MRLDLDAVGYGLDGDGIEDFGSMLEESERESSQRGSIQSGVIVDIGNEYAMISVKGAKQEGRLPISEIQNKDGSLIFNKGDEIEVFVSSNSERPSISYKKVLKARNIKNKIEQLGDDFKDKIIECRVLKRNKGGYIVEFDGVEAFMPKFSSALKDDAKSIGKNIKVCVVDVRPQDETIIVSRKRFFEIDNERRVDVVDKLLNNNQIHSGIVKKIVPFGIFVDIDGVEGLVYYTEISHKGLVNPASLYKEGDSVSVKILEFDKERKRLSLSIKATLSDPWEEIESKLDVGDAIKVIVSNIEPYGAFVDLGNDTEGFLHISEISWSKNIKHPSESISVGQEIVVEIIELDSKQKRLRVSLKKLTDKPFSSFLSKYKAGDSVVGKVVTMTDFGAFVSLGGIDGLLRNEDAFWEKGKRCKDEFKVGEDIEVRILRIDDGLEKVSLIKKPIEESPVYRFSQKYSIGDVVVGNVLDIKDFGVFIRVDDDVDALIKNEDLYPLKKDEINKDDSIEAFIVVIDEKNNRVRVSVKKMEKQRERESIKNFNSDEKMTLGDLIKEQL